jgi:hypothetical protein
MRQYINKLAEMGRRSARAVKTRVSVKTPSHTLFLIEKLAKVGVWSPPGRRHMTHNTRFRPF